MQLLLWVLASGSWKFLRKLKPFYSSPPAGWVHPGLNPWVLRPPLSQRSEPHTKMYLLSVMQEKNKASPSPLKRLPPTAVSGLRPTRQKSIKEGPHHLILKVHRNSGHLSHSVPLTWEKWMLRGESVYVFPEKENLVPVKVKPKTSQYSSAGKKGRRRWRERTLLRSIYIKSTGAYLIWGWESSCFRDKTPGCCYT